MHPACFGMVMATGIVSIASHLLGTDGTAPGIAPGPPAGMAAGVLRWIALALLALNIIFYIALWALTIARVMRHHDRVIADLMHHGRSVGFFTTVAATCVLGSQVWIVGSPLWGGVVWGLPWGRVVWGIAWALWSFGVVLWV